MAYVDCADMDGERSEEQQLLCVCVCVDWKPICGECESEQLNAELYDHNKCMAYRKMSDKEQTEQSKAKDRQKERENVRKRKRKTIKWNKNICTYRI